MLIGNRDFHRDSTGRPVIPIEPEALYTFGHLIRCTEQLLLDLFGKGQVSGTTHTAIGQELCQMAVVRALRDGDAVLSNHRNHGHFLTYSGDFTGLIAEVMGRQAGVCRGQGGSQHIAWRHFHSNGVQGGMTAIGVGHGLARKLKGQDAVVAVFLGDGTLGQGLLYEALNLASCWSAPVLFVVENNHIAQTTETKQTIGGSIAQRGQAFGLRTWELADNSPGFLHEAEQAVGWIRQHGTPGLMVIDTRRLGPHSKGDDLRPQEEIDRIHDRDPLRQLGGSIDPGIRREIEEAARAYLEAALSAAERSPESRWDDPPRSIWSRPAPAAPSAPANRPAGGNVRQSINAALRRRLREDSSVLLLGEDLHEPYGGAFKVTEGLSREFPGRVISTPISEAGVVGAAIGLALDGFRPIVEVMFADFIGLAFDQIYNHAVKFPALLGDSAVPLLIRTPSGGRRGYGPTHSQSPENFLSSIPGLTVVFPSHRHDCGALLETASRDWPYPTVFLEHKLLYGLPCDPRHYLAAGADARDAGAHLFPVLSSGESSPDVTLVTYGGMASVVERAGVLLEEEELSVEIVILSLLAPLPAHTLRAALMGRKRIVIVEESHSGFGVGAELAACLAESGFTGKLVRLGTPPVPIPAARSLESQVIPGESDIFDAVVALF